MLSAATSAKATAHWASEFSCAPEAMFAESQHVMPHGRALAGYNGVFALFREGRMMMSVPEPRLDEWIDRMPAEPLHPKMWAALFRAFDFRVIGPAFIGYAEEIGEAGDRARILDAGDAAQAALLENACEPEEWDHGGSVVGEVPCSGVFTEDGSLAALAGYEVWSGTIAHISIVTHPGFRGRGYGRDAVAHLARRAIAAGLVPQYRTLTANAPSMRIAAALGFQHYATSVAIRLGELEKRQPSISESSPRPD